MRLRKAKQIFRSIYRKGASLNWKPETIARMQKRMHQGPLGSIMIGDIYEDCAHHPVRCEEIYIGPGLDDISGVSLIDGSRPRSCSLKHCGVIRLTENEAKIRIDAFKKDGERGLMKVVGYSDDSIEEFMKNWREK